MTDHHEEFENHVLNLADSRCMILHPRLYEDIAEIFVGNSALAAQVPCHDCIHNVRAELLAKQRKAHSV